MAGNTFWEARQGQMARQYALQLASILSTQIVLRTNLLIILKAAGFPNIPISASDISDFQDDVALNGLPVSLKNLFIQLGADNQTIEEITDLLIAVDPNSSAGNFPDVLADPQFLAALAQAVQVLNEFGSSISAPLSVAVKIKSDSGPINPKSNGVTPITVLTTPNFNAAAINASSVRFGVTGSEAAPVKFASEDIDKDGDVDMVLHFKTQETGINCAKSFVSLTGGTFSGQMFAGSNSIKLVGCK